MKMLPEDLSEGELVHELKIRNLNHLASRRERTAALRSRLKQEEDKVSLSPTYRDDIFEVESEFQICESKMDLLNGALDTAHKAKDYAAFFQAVSRVKHLAGRLVRLVEAFPEDLRFAEAKAAVLETLKNTGKVDFGKSKVSGAYPKTSRPGVNDVVDFNLQGADSHYVLPKEKSLLTIPTSRSGSKSQRVGSDNISEVSNKMMAEKYDILEKKFDLLTESLSRLFAQSNLGDVLNPRASTTALDNTPRPNNQSHVSYDQFRMNFDAPVEQRRRDDQDRGLGNRGVFRDEPLQEEQNPRRLFDRAAAANRLHKKSIPVNQWNVKFSGDESGLSLSEFLGEVELFAKSERLSREDLFDSAVHLFSGAARKWFKAHYLELHSWDELVEGLKFEYQPEYYDYMLLSEIDSRFQGKDETFCSFLAEMQILFGKLGHPLGEHHKLYILRKNMHSSYAVALATVETNTVRQLAIICKRIDSSKLMQVKQGMTTASQVRYVEPAFRTPVNFNKRFQNVNEIEEEYEPRDNMIEAMRFNVQGDRVQNKILKCFKCEGTGHMHRDCKVPQAFYFCYNCGLKNVTVSNCPNCNKYKNLNE